MSESQLANISAAFDKPQRNQTRMALAQILRYLSPLSPSLSLSLSPSLSPSLQITPDDVRRFNTREQEKRSS